jgi:membrane protease YdiL (CAAX protease family)
MPDPPIDPALELFSFGMLVLSVTACMQVLAMHRRGGVLTYEPRRPVPWNAIGCTLAALVLLNVAVSALLSNGTAVAGDETLKSPSVSTLVSGMILQLVIVLGFLLVVAVLSKATLNDVGLPATLRMLVRDVLVGAAACLTALAPVHTVQQVMMFLVFGKPTTSAHPFIKRVIESPDSGLLLWTGVATVIVAPICEEITFRLLLQGWLERWEDKRLGWRHMAAESPAIDQDLLISSETETNAPRPSTEIVPALANPEPPRRGIGGLRYGWFPIIVSAAVFGIAHVGYGPEPVPIFLLGLVLGYVYQRTHRIVPSIVAHALFNLFTIFVLWRMLYSHG